MDGKPILLWSAEYPYFRDARENWRPRLTAIRDAGVPFVTTYIPWRHHAPEDPRKGGGYDFTGETQPNRDVDGFLDLCMELDLRVVVKPGPFIHAELPYGGLPDYVDPERNPEIEPERRSDGSPYRWSVVEESEGGGRALPAPLSDAFVNYVREWLEEVSRRIVRPHCAPDGPIVAVQLLNEGIYSDSASGLLTNFGYAKSTTARWHAFLERSYDNLDAYNHAHDTTIEDWSEAEPPRALEEGGSPARMLVYLDRSRWYHDLYDDVLRRYGGFLRDAGVPREVPIFLNINPNVASYRDYPGSNDGWFSKVGKSTHQDFEWGYTDWIGLVAHHPRAHLQYVLAGTRKRGVNLEENWGFSHHYDPYYRYTQPSYFQSLLALATGATGLNVYTIVGTSAWREDKNLHDGAADAPEYPQSAPMAADGTPRAKWWTIRQLSQYFDAEGAGLVGRRRADIAWAAYPPYAWAGAWCPLGTAGEAAWTGSGFRASPRLTYHGLEPFLEASLARNLDVGQVDVLDADDEEIAKWRMLALAAYDYMDAETERKLERYVRQGGVLLVTGMLPTFDEKLRASDEHPLREVFPHGEESFERLPHAERLPVLLDEERIGVAVEWIVRVAPPEDAVATAVAGESPVGYVRKHGEGTAIFLGYLPWYGALLGDDLRLAAANQNLVRHLAERHSSCALSYAKAAQAYGVDVWQYEGTREPGDEHLFVVNRALVPEAARIEYKDAEGASRSIRLSLVPQTVCLLAVNRGDVRSFLLKCVNDAAQVSVPPFVEAENGTWEASAPCDLCVTRVDATTFRVSVANAPAGGVILTTPFAPEEVAEAAYAGKAPLPHERGPRAAFRIRDIAEAGTATLRLHRAPGASR